MLGTPVKCSPFVAFVLLPGAVGCRCLLTFALSLLTILPGLSLDLSLPFHLLSLSFHQRFVKLV